MNYGPLEFAAYLASKVSQRDSATVEAARAAAPADIPETARLTVISGSTLLARVARDAQVEAVSVYEAVAVHTRGALNAACPVGVLVRSTPRPVLLVLSAHQTVRWEISLLPGAALCAVLLSGYGDSKVAGAGTALVTSIGGFYAFRRGSPEFKHLESEVMRCTGRHIDSFQSVFAGRSFEVG